MKPDPKCRVFEHLAAVANELAPNREVREAFRALQHELSCDPRSVEKRTLVFIGVIYDGLAYGNWPGVAP